MSLLLLLAAAPLSAHGQTPAEFDAWVKKLDREKHVPAHVGVHVVAGKPLFSAVAADNTARREWDIRRDLAPAAFNALVVERIKEGWRLVSFVPYNGRFVAAWVKDNSVEYLVRYGLSRDDYQKYFDEQAKAGFRPAALHGYLEGKAVRFAVILDRAGGDWSTHHGLSESDFKRMMADYARRGRRPVWLSAFHDGKETRYNVVVLNDGRRGLYREGLDAAGYETFAAEQAKAGATLVGLDGYATPKGSRYLGYWVMPKKELALPISGTEVPALAAFDRAMLTYMKGREIEAGALAVARNGKLVLSRGYGFPTRDRKKPLPADAPFRLASVTKAITAAVVYDLVARGKLKLTDKAFDLIGIDLPPGKEADPRLKKITVRMLLDHEGGWDRDAKPLYDPMFQSNRIRKALALDGPPTALDTIRFMNGRKLDFDPGSKSVYSNYGYCVLGRVIETASGESYGAAVKRLVAPLGAKSFELARTRVEDRNPAEPFYSDPALVPDLIRGTGSVAYPDGGFVIEAMDAHGGLIASAPDVAKFCAAYSLTGQPRKGKARLTAWGGLPGTCTMAKQRPDGVDIVALFNQRNGPEEMKEHAIEKLLDDAAVAIKEWP